VELTYIELGEAFDPLDAWNYACPRCMATFRFIGHGYPEAMASMEQALHAADWGCPP
jgi:hypothetical protein